MRHAAWLTLAIVACPVAASAQDLIRLTPEQIGQVFCISRIGNDSGPITGLLTDDLSSAILAAEALNDAAALAAPGDKPPLGDGIPWQTAPDYAAKCDVGAVTGTSGETSVEIKYGFPEAPAANFTDTLALVEIDDPEVGEKVWRIDNVVYADKSDLKKTLSEAFR